MGIEKLLEASNYLKTVYIDFVGDANIEEYFYLGVGYLNEDELDSSLEWLEKSYEAYLSVY